MDSKDLLAFANELLASGEDPNRVFVQVVAANTASQSPLPDAALHELAAFLLEAARAKSAGGTPQTGPPAGQPQDRAEGGNVHQCTSAPGPPGPTENQEQQVQKGPPSPPSPPRHLSGQNSFGRVLSDPTGAPNPEGRPAQPPSAGGSPSPPNGQSVEDRACQLAEALAADIALWEERDMWRAPFDLARVVRKVADDHPERFQRAVQRFCEVIGADFADVWFPFFKVFPEIRLPAGQGKFDVAARHALDEAGRPCLTLTQDLGHPHADAVASLAYELAGLAEDAVIYLPRKRIAKWLGIKRHATVSMIVTLLVRVGVLTPDDESYSYKDGQCKTYRFTATKEMYTVRKDAR
jgi:hypothetical protein